ncbi:MAG TPA: hypothetical protein DCS82_05175, partial [Rhodospirillaceae bacterium]|nr:hypothetical protein [Rhodospirillaceae bacterium]
MGANHAPLRRSFFRTRIVAPDGGASDQPRHILISPGATDPTDISSHALDAIRHAGLDVSVTIALGSAAPHKEKVDAKLSDHDAELLIDCNDMAGEISRADLVIGAGGMSAWERCCLGKPTLMAVTAANQKANAAALSEMGAIQVVEAPEDSHLFGQTISGLLSDANALRNMKNRAIELCDGLGSARLAIAATPAPKAKDGKPVSLRPVTREDSDIMFAWQQEPEMRRYARNRQTPKRDEHESWL